MGIHFRSDWILFWWADIRTNSHKWSLRLIGAIITARNSFLSSTVCLSAVFQDRDHVFQSSEKWAIRLLAWCTTSLCSETYTALVRHALANSSMSKKKPAARRFSCADQRYGTDRPWTFATATIFQNVIFRSRHVFCNYLDNDWSKLELLLLSHLAKWNYST